MMAVVPSERPPRVPSGLLLFPPHSISSESSKQQLRPLEQPLHPVSAPPVGSSSSAYHKPHCQYRLCGPRQHSRPTMSSSSNSNSSSSSCGGVGRTSLRALPVPAGFLRAPLSSSRGSPCASLLGSNSSSSRAAPMLPSAPPGTKGPPASAPAGSPRQPWLPFLPLPRRAPRACMQQGRAGRHVLQPLPPSHWNQLWQHQAHQLLP